jgi:hypothetical protein
VIRIGRVFFVSILLLAGAVAGERASEQRLPPVSGDRAARRFVDEAPGSGNSSDDRGKDAYGQEDFKRDTDRLLQLATDLKAQVDKTNENLMSVSVIRKAEEVEALAHSVRVKVETKK